MGYAIMVVSEKPSVIIHKADAYKTNYGINRNTQQPAPPGGAGFAMSFSYSRQYNLSDR